MTLIGTFGRGIGIFNKNGGGGGGSVTDAKNGTHLNGSIVYLGGSLLEPTVIDITGFGVAFFGANSLFQIFDSTGIDLGWLHGGDSLRLVYQDSGGRGSLGLLLQNGVNQKGVFLTGDQLGIEIADQIDMAGLVGQADFTNPAIPNQYVQRPAILPVSRFSGTTISVTTDVFVLTTDPATDRAYRITAALFATVGGGSVKLTATYTSFDTVPRFLDLGPALVATGDAAYAPLTIICLANSTITITAFVVAGVNCEVIGCIEEVGGF